MDDGSSIMNSSSSASMIVDKISGPTRFFPLKQPRNEPEIIIKNFRVINSPLPPHGEGQYPCQGVGQDLTFTLGSGNPFWNTWATGVRSGDGAGEGGNWSLRSKGANNPFQRPPLERSLSVMTPGADQIVHPSVTPSLPVQLLPQPDGQTQKWSNVVIKAPANFRDSLHLYNNVPNPDNHQPQYMNAPPGRNLPVIDEAGYASLIITNKKKKEPLYEKIPGDNRWSGGST